MAQRNLDQAYTHFFARRARYPVLKKKHAARQTFAYPQRVRLNEGRIFLPKVGLVKAVVHRGVIGTITRAKSRRSGYSQISLMGMICLWVGHFLPRPAVFPTGIQLAAL